MATTVRNENGEIIFKTSLNGSVSRQLTPDTNTGTRTSISIKPLWRETVYATLSTRVTLPNGDFRDDVIYSEDTNSQVPPGKTVVLRVDGPTPQSRQVLLVTRER